MKFKIKRAKRSEFRDVAKLLKRVFSSPPWNENWTFANALKSVESYAKQGSVYVVVLDGKMVAGAIVREGYYVDGPFIVMEELFVGADLQGQGVGGMLLDRIENDYSKKGFAMEYVVTMRGCPAAKFYRKRGFRESYMNLNLEKDLR